ncbi:MAG: hypothetical protein AAGK97_13565 [Bacteroidota bacterium]
MRYIIYIWCVLIVTACQVAKEVNPQKEVIHCTLKFDDMKDSIQAGQACLISIHNSEEANVVPQLKVEHKFGSSILQLSKKEPVFELPTSLTAIAGLMKFTLLANDAPCDYAEIYIQASQGKQLMNTFIGPKTIAIRDQQNSMMAAIPRDIYHNGLEDGAEIVINEGSEAYQNTQTNRIRNLVNYHLISAMSKPGDIFIGGKSNASISEEQTMSYTSNLPSNIKMQVRNHYPYADGRQHVYIQTEQVMDAKNNIVSDGTKLTFKVLDSNGRISLYNAYTVAGIASVYIQNPSIVCSYTISILEDTKTDFSKIELSFKSGVKEIPYTVQKDEIQIGPLKGPLNQTIPEGSIMKFYGSCGGKLIELEKEVQRGYVIVRRSELCQGSWQGEMSILGKQKKLEFE